MKRARSLMMSIAMVGGLLVVSLIHQQQEPEPKTSFEKRLEAMDKQIDSTRKILSDSWLPYQRLAEVYMAKAKLTGKYDWYDKARQALDKAFTIAPKNSGPYMTLAKLHYTLHRVDAAEKALIMVKKRFFITNREQAEIHGFEGDISFHRSEYSDARQSYYRAIELDPSFQNYFRLAYLNWQTGKFNNAHFYVDLAEGAYKGKDKYPLAWLDLQRGLMDLDRSRLGEALAHYQDADRHFGGHWLIREHMAEIHALKGEYSTAEKMYVELIEKTGSPEFMDALGRIYAETGKSERALKWLNKARVEYDSRLERFPSAAAGHALDHYLENESDGDKVVKLARYNFELRPNGEATVKLAQALLLNSQLDEAKWYIDVAIRRGYKSADLTEVANEIYAKMGKELASFY